MATEPADPLAVLAPAQRLILELMCHGLGTKDICARLNIVSQTLYNQKAAIFKRLGVTSSIEAVLVAQRAAAQQAATTPPP